MSRVFDSNILIYYVLFAHVGWPFPIQSLSPRRRGSPIHNPKSEHLLLVQQVEFVHQGFEFVARFVGRLFGQARL